MHSKGTTFEQQRTIFWLVINFHRQFLEKKLEFLSCKHFNHVLNWFHEKKKKFCSFERKKLGDAVANEINTSSKLLVVAINVCLCLSTLSNMAPNIAIQVV